MTPLPAENVSARIARRPHVFRPDELPSIERGTGVRTIPLVTAARGATNFLTGITAFGPSTAISHHIHNVAESVMIIAGNAIVDIDGTRTPLRTFDTTFVPANIPHHFENASDTEEMRILWIYGSLDTTRTLLADGRAGRIDDEQLSDEPDARVRPVIEVATIEVLPGREEAFEEAVAAATPLFQQAEGARTLRLERSEEFPQRYRLIIGWDSVADHMDGFRGSPLFLAWRELIGEHIAGTPEVEHLRTALTGF